MQIILQSLKKVEDDEKLVKEKAACKVEHEVKERVKTYKD